MKTPQDIYKLCPQLKDISERLLESVKDKAEENRIRKSKNNGSRELYPEHYKIEQIYINNNWIDTGLKSKPGNDNKFEEDIVKLVNTREPQALKILIYNGKRPTSNYDTLTCYLAENAEIISEIKNKGLNGPEEQGLTLLRTEIDKMKVSDKSEASFSLQLKDLEHKQEIHTLTVKHEREIEKKDRLIEDLEAEIEDLEEEKAEMDAELGSAADRLQEKVAPKPLQVLLTAVAEDALEQFIINRPKIVKDVLSLKLSDDQIKDIFTRTNKQQIENAPSAENQGSEASFTKSKKEDEYKGFDEKHAEALKNIHIFNKALPKDKFQLLYNVFAFCCTATGDFNEDHTNQLLAFLIPIAKAEEEAASAT